MNHENATLILCTGVRFTDDTGRGPRQWFHVRRENVRRSRVPQPKVVFTDKDGQKYLYAPEGSSMLKLQSAQILPFRIRGFRPDSVRSAFSPKDQEGAGLLNLRLRTAKKGGHADAASTQSR